MKKFQIIQGTSKEISCSFSERPSVYSCALFKPDKTVLAASGICSTSGLQVTVSDDSGNSQSDRNELSLCEPSYSSLKIGNTYKLTNASQQYEYVKLSALPSSREASVLEPLKFDYEDGDSLQETNVTRTITTDESATLGLNYRARFTATLSDGSYIEDVLFDVVNSICEQPITAENLADYDFVLANDDRHEGLEGSNWERQLEIAWHDVLVDIRGLQIRPENLLDEKQLATLHLLKFKHNLARIGISPEDHPSGYALQEYRTEYIQLLDLIKDSFSWNDKDEDLVNDDGETDETFNYPYALLG